MCKLTIKLLLSWGLIASHAANADIVDGEELADPTRPFYLDQSGGSAIVPEFFRTAVPSSYNVTFVRASTTSPLAVINNQRVTVGDIIGGALVTAIDRNSVTLLINDEERTIRVYDASIKAPVTER